MNIYNKSETNEFPQEKKIGFETEFKPVEMPIPEYLSQENLARDQRALFPSYETPYLSITESEIKSIDSNSDSFWGKFKRRIKSVPKFETQGVMQVLIYIQIIVPLVSHLFGFAQFIEMIGIKHWGRFIASFLMSSGFELFTYFRVVALKPSKLESYGYILLSTAFSVLAWSKFYYSGDDFKFFPFIVAVGFYFGLAKTLHTSCEKLREIIEKNQEIAKQKRIEIAKMKIENPELHQEKFVREKKLTKETKQSIINFALNQLGSVEGCSTSDIEERFGIKKTTATRYLNIAESIYIQRKEKFSEAEKFIQPPKRIYSSRNTSTKKKPQKNRNTPTVNAFEGVTA
jgi:negative regulator of replication initiation